MDECFFLVLAHLRSPRQRAVKWLLVVVVASNVRVTSTLFLVH